MGENSKKMQPRAGEAAAEWVSLSSLRPWADNPRHNDGKPVEKVAESIKRFGFASPIIARADGEIIAGHTRYKAAQALGLDRVPVRFLDLDPADAHLLAVADNRLGEFAEWDTPKLQEILSDFSFDDAALAGYTQEDFDEWARELAALEVTEDEAPEVPKEPTTKAGDLWVLGDHRVLCGDATSAEDVERLMGGKTADLCVTDPPYTVNYDRSQGERGGDPLVHSPFVESNLDPTVILGFMRVVPSQVMIWTYPVDRHFQALAKAYSDHGWEFKKELVWVKDQFSFWMSAKYQQKHEPIMIAVRKGAPIGGNVPASATTVMEYPRPKAHSLHPTAKPLELWAGFVTNHTKMGGAVYDPFLGSGTTLIAAEQLGRRCYGLEISPAYCDVIVERWENLTGGKAKRE